MRIGLQDVDWAYVGAKLAQSHDDNQASFFRAFVKECLSWGTSFQVEKQLSLVNLKLTKEEREVLSMLGFAEVDGE